MTATVIAGSGAAGALPALPNGSLGLPTAPTVDLDKSFTKFAAELGKKLPGRVGLAVTPVGGDAPASFGALTTARAWSTMKVPVALAAERARGQAVFADETKAITVSNNEAAEALWGALGGGRASVDAVTGVLREGRDVRTHVASELDRPPSYPGYTAWAVADQSIFAANLPCLPGSGRVLDLMGKVGANQQWGVFAPKAKGVTSAVKGGWGPISDASGKQIVRQLAVVTSPRGRYGVAIAAAPDSGSMNDGTAMVTRVGQWLLKNLQSFTPGTCPPIAVPAPVPDPGSTPKAPAPEAAPRPGPDAAPAPAPAAKRVPAPAAKRVPARGRQ